MSEDIKYNFFIRYTLHCQKMGSQLLKFDEAISIEESPICQIKLYYEKDNGIGKLVSQGIFKYELGNRRLSKFHEFQGKTLFTNQVKGTINQFVNDEINNWLDKPKEIVEIFRWRYGLGGDNIIESSQLEWSLDNDIWHKISVVPEDGFSSRVVVFQNLTKNIIQDSIQNLVASKKHEPLAHKLIRESFSLISQNPRSSYIMGVVALEIGVKEYIKNNRPQTEWLLTYSPSPYVYKIINEYFPEINPAFFLSKNDYKLLRETVDYRNKIVHLGIFELTRYQLSKRLNLIRDIIWLIDYHNGNKWAKPFISKERQSLIN